MIVHEVNRLLTRGPYCKSMRKVFQGTVLAVALVVSVASPGVAHAASPETLVTGYVLKNGLSLSGMTVTASCGRYFADTDVTDATGAYLISFSISECGWGSDVELLATSDTDFATARGTTYKVTSKLNIANTIIRVQ